MTPRAKPCTPSERSETTDIVQAKLILRGKQATPQEMLDLAETLKQKNRFGYARKLIGRARSIGTDDQKLLRKLRQRHALCTYKDQDLPIDSRLARALEILADGEDLSTTQDQETLGLAGAIYKRRWEVDTQKENLERSLFYYLRGYEQGPEGDQGYTSINAAYVLDFLANLEEHEAKKAGTRSEIAATRRGDARRIREELIEKLPPLVDQPDTRWLTEEWWFYATLAEACFGLGSYDEATEWIRKGKKITEVPEWEFQSTALQLAALARIQKDVLLSATDFENTDAGHVLAELLGHQVAAARTAYVGKVGLGLSGGGFRASLFHIGVLAKLAELDVLKHVEVLSCVSGGSILGGHYYLEVKNLLENKADEDITRQDYIDIVRRLERDFLQGVQKNIRTRVAAELLTNLKMIFLPGYSRTMRAGELYEKWLFSKVPDGNGAKLRWITDLYVKPKGEKVEFFKPRADNWKRRAKVPDIILNVTTLNTGHNWQFTASWMGEPPVGINTEVDANYRLRRMYYWEAPERHQCIRLGHAVAASACVPGLFEPLVLKGLYDNITVQLVDGGVHDNQGIVGLLEQDCDVLLISDASGQMGTQNEPSSGFLGVPLRSNSILMSRVRTEQYDDLMARKRSGLLRGLMFIHLKKDLDADPINWANCQDRFEATDDARPASRQGVLTRYGLLKDVQKKVAELRTDLDSFSEAEAFALMLSGYRMTEHAFKHEESLRAFPSEEGSPEDWRFLRVGRAMTEATESGRLLRHLEVGANQAFKVWRLLTPLKILAAVLTVAAAGGLVWLFGKYWSASLVKVSTLGWIAIGAAGTAVLGKCFMRIVQFRSTLQKIGIGVGLALVGWLLARLHIWVFDRLFLRNGKADRGT